MASKKSTHPTRVLAQQFIEDCVHRAFESYFRAAAVVNPQGSSGLAVCAFTDALRRRLEHMEASEVANGWRQEVARG